MYDDRDSQACITAPVAVDASSARTEPTARMDDGSRVAPASQTDLRRALDDFLADVESRAFRYALVAVRNADDALDVVQDAMMALVRRYAHRPADEWRPLFFRILGNRARDFNRRGKVRSRLLQWFTRSDQANGEPPHNPVEDLPARESSDPSVRLEQDTAMGALDDALRALPDRQREAFMLRVFEGLDVAQTAAAMGCSQGSVKTHHARAIAKLRECLGDYR